MGWPIVKLGDISLVITKGTTPTSVGFKFIPEGINFVKVESITSEGRFLPHKFAAISDKCNESLKRSQLKEGDVLFSIAGALGRTALVTSDILPANTNQALAIIRLKTDVAIDKRFLLLALTTGVTLDQVEKNKGGVAQQNLSLGQLKSFEIPLPAIPEQKRIVAILDQAFADIEQARAKTEQNLKNARELFESYLQQVFSQRGEGWVEDKLSNICDVRDGTHDSPKYVDTGIPFVTQKNIRDDGLCFKKTKFISELDHQHFYKRSNVAQGDLLISMIGANRGMTCLVDDNRVFSIKNVGLIKKSQQMNMEFLLYYLKTSFSKNYIESESRGGAQPFIGLTKLRAFPVFYAPLNVQKNVVDQLKTIDFRSRQLVELYDKKLQSLDELKKSILQKAFSGELTKEQEGAAA